MPGPVAVPSTEGNGESNNNIISEVHNQEAIDDKTKYVLIFFLWARLDRTQGDMICIKCVNRCLYAKSDAKVTPK